MVRLSSAAAACTALLLQDAVRAAPDADAVPLLPGWGAPPSKMWSGYLDASAVEEGTMLHYWFAEAEVEDPRKKPVVLWLNGGPGSSSILGMLQEQGPLLINATGGLFKNPYAWTKQANLLFLESPGGVGYSYCAAMKKGGNCHNTDNSTARAARAAVQDFFKNKFPELVDNEFFITGESYAGVYIPTLTNEILNEAKEVKMTGIAVGDPCTDMQSQSQSMDMLWYSHKNGFVTDPDFDFLYNTCGHRHPSFLSQGQWKRAAGGKWELPKMTKTTQVLQNSEDELKCKIAQRRYLATTSKGLSQGWSNAYINELDLYVDAAAVDWDSPGSLDFYTARWMNRDDVKKALHVESAPTKAWPGPPEGWQYTSHFDACNSAVPAGAPSMVEFYRKIAPQMKTTIVFNGDVDPCVSYEGTRNAIHKVGFPIIPGGQYRPWFYNHKASTVEILEAKPNLFGPNLALKSSGAQFGGQVINYAHNLSFATVHGSGHMVPQFRPQSAERLLSTLLSGVSFAPLLPTDEEMGAMTDDEFDASVEQWTKSAKDMVVTSAKAESVDASIVV